MDDTKWCNYGVKTPNLWPSARCPSEDKGHSCVSFMSDESFVVVLWQKRETRERMGRWGGGEVAEGVGIRALWAHMTFTWLVWIKPSRSSRSLWRKHLYHATWAEIRSPNPPRASPVPQRPPHTPHDDVTSASPQPFGKAEPQQEYNQNVHLRSQRKDTVSVRRFCFWWKKMPCQSD